MKRTFHVIEIASTRSIARRHLASVKHISSQTIAKVDDVMPDQQMVNCYGRRGRANPYRSRGFSGFAGLG